MPQPHPFTTPLQAYAQQMAQLVARQEQQIAAACRRVLEQHEVAMAEQAQQAEIRSVVNGLVSRLERAQAKAQAEAELTYVRLCEYCGRSAFKSNVAYGYHKR